MALSDMRVSGRIAPRRTEDQGLLREDCIKFLVSFFVNSQGTQYLLIPRELWKKLVVVF